MLTVKPHPESLGALAQVAEVQRIEYASARTLLNDLTRVRQQVSADTLAATNYLNLSGSGVTLNLNDTGADGGHPDLIGRLSSADPAWLVDLDGHGTHVAGTIIGNGTNSFSALDTSGNPPSGSVLGASFRGMAPEASLFVLPVDLKVGPLLSDRYLQETAASNNFVVLGRTNAVISNNSWAYVNAFEYNFASASYDAAVRDGLSGVPGFAICTSIPGTGRWAGRWPAARGRRRPTSSPVANPRWISLSSEWSNAGELFDATGAQLAK